MTSPAGRTSRILASNRVRPEVTIDLLVSMIGMWWSPVVTHAGCCGHPERRRQGDMNKGKVVPQALVDIADGRWYRCMMPALESLRDEARQACWHHNTMPPAMRGACAPELAAILGMLGDRVFLEAPFHVAYGHNLVLAEGVYINANCVVLDTAPVRIGARTMLGPAVHIYCADHAHGLEERRQGLERALPVNIGEDVWIGGGALVLPGVTIGDGAIIGAGAVVRHDVAPSARVAGNPARPI